MFDKLIFAMPVDWKLVVNTFAHRDCIKYIVTVFDENNSLVETAKWIPGFNDDYMQFLVDRVVAVAASPIIP